MQIKSHHRRGITLMFVMSMIVLFLLLATTFVVVSNNYFRASKKRATKEVHTIDGTAFVERAFSDLVRGPDLSNTTSPLRGQDLLSDMYGYGFKAEVSIASEADAIIPASRDSVPTAGLGQLIAIEFAIIDLATGDDAVRIRDNAPFILSTANNEFNGRVLTFITGKAAGISVRIVDYQIEYDASGTVVAKRFIILVPGRLDRGTFPVTDLVGNRVVVNGQAFAGVGAGGEAGSTDEATPVLGDLALEPNRVGIDRATLVGPGGYLALNVGPNESYDGVDHQNMFLSGFDLSGNRLIPSFYRYSLALYRGDSNAGPTATRHMFTAFDHLGFEDDLDGDLIPDGYVIEMDVDNDNDGVKDSVWIDPGYPIQSNGNGLYFKALVAYHVVDLDSRLNINAVGNQSDLNNGSPPRAGDGYGPAEISLSGFLSPGPAYQNLLLGNISGLPGRYGLNGVPGAAGRDEWSIKKLFGYPDTTNTIGKLFQSSPIDIRGRFAIGTPGVTLFTDLNDDPAFPFRFNNALPVMNTTPYIPAADTFTNSPYEANFAPSPYSRWETGDDDTPFSALELEKLLRPFDADSNLLASRLTELLGIDAVNSSKRKSMTTDSFEVPMAPARTVDSSGTVRPLMDILRGKITVVPAEDEDLYIRELISFEVLSGMKMDINRVFGNGFDDNGNEVIDDPLETAQQYNVDQFRADRMDLDNDFQPGVNDDLARTKFAKQLYILMLLVCEDEVELDPGLTAAENLEAYRTAVAQWAINVVDFRDPDSIHTGFEFDLDPWNGWDVDGDLSTDEGIDRGVVWGAERPELLFSEASATHDRACEDLAIGGLVPPPAPPGDDDFDSRLVPRTSAFIELYHPWTQNSNHQNLPSELARNPASPAGVDLQRLSPGDDPVWRIGVRRLANDTGFLRTIYFTDLTANPPNFPPMAEQFSTSHTFPVIAPGGFAVIGSEGISAGSGYRTTFSRLSTAAEGTALSLKLDETRSITLDPTMDPMDDQILRNEWDGTAMVETGYKGIAIVMDLPRSLSLSDPDGGYPNYPATNPRIPVGDGDAYTTPIDTPLDVTFGDADDKAAIWNNGTYDRFRTLFLQRLANPLLDYDEFTNPYITIDVTPVDLVSFNGTQDYSTHNSPDQNERVGGVTNVETDFGSLERGESPVSGVVSPARVLFGWDGGTVTSGTPSPPVLTGSPDGEHNFSYVFDESFGRVNEAYQSTTVEFPRFSWLTWNNRPFVSQLELANVPFVSSEYMTRAFSLRMDTPMYDPYINSAPSTFLADNPSLALGSSFGHLLNFYGHDPASNPALGNFYRLFDFTEVPSRYVGTEFWPNSGPVPSGPAPGPGHFINNPANFFSHYRYPGKININTVSREVYTALMGAYFGQLNFVDFDDARWEAKVLTMSPVAPLTDPEFFRPFRNTGEGSLVPDLPLSSDSLVEENVDCGLYRRNAAGDPLFDYDSALAYNNTDRSAYFRNAMRQRMGNLVTTRSSVFAIWITVGYFEVNENGTLKNVAGGGVEIGAETGEVVRNRGFYIFDRSIPVAFEPGKNHNVERAILVKSIIE